MTNEALSRELAALWTGFRAALADYRLDDVAKYVDLPKDAPAPGRAQAKQFADDLPDLAKARFLDLALDGDRAGYYALLDPGKAVAVIRFRKTPGGWRLVPGPHTVAIVEREETLDLSAARKMVAEEASLGLRPAGDGERDAAPPPAAAAPKGEPPDTRDERVIRRELEGIWRKIRAAFASGKPGNAADVLLWVDGAKEPAPDEAKEAAKAMPDLARGRFIKLVWSVEKPHVVGYVAEVALGDAKKTTVALVVFARKDGAWKFAPGPLALEIITLPPTGQAALRAFVDTDPRFRL